MFKNMLVSGVKNLVETQLNKSSNQGGSAPQQPQNNSNQNMSYGGGYGGQVPQGYGQGGYQPQLGPTELNYSGAGAYPQQAPSYPPQQTGYGNPSPGYPNSSPYPSGDSGNIGFNVAPYPGGGAPYPGGGAPYPGAGASPYPTGGPTGYPQGPSGGQAPAYPQQTPSYPQQAPYGGGGYGAPQGYGTNYGTAPQGFGAPLPQQSTQGMWGNPSVKQYPAFNANTDAETLRKAMKGFGCDNNKVIQVLCARTNGQRQEIARAFKTMYGKDLLADLKSELHGDFEDLVLALMERPPVYDALQLRKAMEGLGTRESVLIEIMTTRTNAQIGELKYVYRQMYGSELERDLIGETSGHFKRLLVSLCAGGRDESMHVDPVRANHDARKLYQAGEGKLGTDESMFNAILAAQNYAQLRLVFDEYQKVCNRSIEQSVQSEFSGDIRDGLLAVCAVIRSKPAYFATLLNNSMKGMGTRDGDLIRAVVTRCEVDMADIRHVFEGMYKQPLEKMIKGDCSGSYKDGLIALVRGN